MKNTPIRHTMVNRDALAAEFCEILNLSDLFGSLLQCSVSATRGRTANGGTEVIVDFSSCIEFGSCGLPHGMAVTGVTITDAVISDQGKTITLDVTPAIDDGDAITWTYTSGSDCIIDCKDLADIGDQSLSIFNPHAPPVYATSGVIAEDRGSVVITFESCIQYGPCAEPYGNSITVDSVPETIISTSISPDGIELTLNTLGDIPDVVPVSWTYDDTNECLHGCTTAQGIGDQTLAIPNPEIPSGLPVMRLNSVDDATGEMLAVGIGVGGMVEARATSLMAKGSDGIYYTYALNKVAWDGGRVVGGVTYGTDAIGDPLDPKPSIISAQEITNACLYCTDQTIGPPYWYPNDPVDIVRDQTGIDGVANTACTISTTDDTAVAQVQKGYFGVGTQLDKYCYVLWIDKDLAATSPVGIFFYSISALVRLDLDIATGEIGTLYPPNGTTIVYRTDVTLVDEVWHVVIENQVADGNATLVLHPDGNVAANVGSFVLRYVGLYEKTLLEVAKNAPPIITADVSLTRTKCDLSVDAANHDNSQGTYIIDGDFQDDVIILDPFLNYTGGNLVLTDTSANSRTVAMSAGSHQIGITYGPAGLDLAIDGLWDAGSVPYGGTLLASGDLKIMQNPIGLSTLLQLDRYEQQDRGLVG